MSSIRRSLVAWALICGCSGSAGPTVPDHAIDTSGDETQDETVHPTRDDAAPAPPVARSELSEPLQGLWTQLEAPTNPPPAGPQETTPDGIDQWWEGTFDVWLSRRVDAIAIPAITAGRQIRPDATHEWGLAAGLVAQASESLAAQIHDAPIPDTVQEDPDLLSSHVSRRDQALGPIVSEVIMQYADCVRRFAELPQDSPWAPWRAYCERRQQAVRDSFGIAEGTGTESAHP